jgi:hypothetical protein
MELIGRSNLGEGALDVNVIDYEKIPIIDPLMLERKLKEDGSLQEFLRIVDKMLKMKPLNLEFEAENSTRLKMEEFILESLGFSKSDVIDFYKELTTLVNLRAKRAASVRTS